MNKNLLGHLNAWMIVFGFVVYGLFFLRTNQAMDFYQFWIVPKACNELKPKSIYYPDSRVHIHDFYERKFQEGNSSDHLMTVSSKRKSLEPGGTPFLYSSFGLISSGNYDLDYQIFRCLSLIGFFAAMGYFCIRFSYGAILIFSTCLFITFFFWPFPLDIQTSANVNQLQVALFALLLWLGEKNKSRISLFSWGVVACLALLFKPNILFAILFYAVLRLAYLNLEKRVLTIAGVVSGVLVGIFLPYFMFGSTCSWADWFRFNPDLLGASVYIRRSLLGILFGLEDAHWHAIVASLIIVFFILGFSWKMKNAGSLTLGGGQAKHFLQDTCAINIGLCLYLLVGPIVHGHYFTLLVPSLIQSLRPVKLDLRQALPGLIAFVLLSVHPLLVRLQVVTIWENDVLSYAAVFFLLVTLIRDLGNSLTILPTNKISTPR